VEFIRCDNRVSRGSSRSNGSLDSILEVFKRVVGYVDIKINNFFPQWNTGKNNIKTNRSCFPNVSFQVMQGRHEIQSKIDVGRA